MNRNVLGNPSLTGGRLATVVIDETHCVSQRGPLIRTQPLAPVLLQVNAPKCDRACADGYGDAPGAARCEGPASRRVFRCVFRRAVVVAFVVAFVVSFVVVQWQ